MGGEGEPARGERPGGRAGFAVSLAASMGVAPLLVFSLSALAPLVMADLHLSRSQLGLVATVFFLASAALATRLGGLIDRLGERQALVLLYSSAAAALVVGAAARSFGVVLLGVGLAGIGQAMANPLTNAMIARRFRAGDRGMLMGIKQSGVQMGQSVAGLLFPLVAAAVTWRGSLLTGAALVLGALAWGWSQTRSRPVTRLRRGARTRLRDLPRPLWSLTLYALLSGAAAQATSFYLPLFGHEVLGMPVPVAALTAALAGAMGVAGRIVWGRATDTMRSPSTPLAFLGAGAVTGTVLIGVASIGGSAVPLWIGAAVFGFTGLATNVILMAAVLDLVALDVAGNATGLLTTGLFLGFAVGPAGFGALVDLTGSYTTGWVVVLGVLLLALVLAVGTLGVGRADRAQ